MIFFFVKEGIYMIDDYKIYVEEIKKWFFFRVRNVCCMDVFCKFWKIFGKDLIES